MGKKKNRNFRRRAAAVFLAAGLLLSLPGETGAVLRENVKREGLAEIPAPPVLAAQAAVLMDGDTGRILFEKNGEEVRPMASTTKIMTCIVALENASLDDVVEVSSYAASMPDVQLNIRQGETYYLRDLLHSLMLESHNDSAVAIAEHVAGSKEAFAGLMNQKARDLGCVNTCFLTPNGLDAADEKTGRVHSTTAGELAKMFRYCTELSPKKEEFLAITRAPSHAFSNIERTRSFSCVNHNALLTSMEGAVSGKTGFTNDAGYCYVGEVKRGEKTFIAALLGCGWPPHKNYKWQDMEKLLRFGDENYDFQVIRPEKLELSPVLVKDGVGETFGEEAKVRLEPGLVSGGEGIRILMGAHEPVTVKKMTPRSLKAPVEAGVMVGQVDYYVGEDLAASYPLRTAEAVRKWTYLYCLKEAAARFAGN